MGDTLRSQTISTRLQQIAQRAQNEPDLIFNNLYHLIDLPLLREAYRLTRKDAAPGIDHVTAKHYAKDLDDNLQRLHQQLRERRYKAPPVKRCWIHEDTGKDRPIGIPPFEDKIVQRAAVMIMSAIYDQDFHEFSYGFIKGKSQHQALNVLRNHLMEGQGCWVVDADVSGFFDNLNRTHLRSFIERRINDGGIKQLIGKWLNAGVFEDGVVNYPDKGSPQGGVISPLLANIYLHYVLDEWFVEHVQPRMQGRCFIVRFADDFVIGCERESDARRILDVLPRRFSRFGLMIHPTKTQQIEFTKPPRRKDAGSEKSTLNFLGFTHYWTRSRRGYWIIKRQTERKRQRRFMTRLWHWCKANRHELLTEQHRTLCAKLRGYYQYYGIRSNYKALEAVYEHAQKAWRRWLARRSHDSGLYWQRFVATILSVYPLPKPKLTHEI